MIRERYYRCYLLRDDHVARHEDVFSYDDLGAIEKAEGILAGAEHLSIEVWRGRQHVATVNKNIALATPPSRGETFHV
jgi:hypothetical protein